ncbi:toll-like receptor 3 isoform 1-T1 [Synchiropus picturatus]
MCVTRRQVIIIALLMMASLSCVAPEKKTSCFVRDDYADCSRLSLKAVPADLPRSIRGLDMSHNRLLEVPIFSLRPYSRLSRLDVSYNSITKVNRSLCELLPLLQTLNVNHNELHVLVKEDMGSCSRLTFFHVAGNRLKLKGETFAALQNLQFLDVSNNNLQTAKLGSHPQLPNLVKLNLGFNSFVQLNRDDFNFLNLSSSLQVLNMSSVPLKRMEPGCFLPIRDFGTLIMDGSNLGPLAVPKLCSELSETKVTALSLRRLKLVTLSADTLMGLEKTDVTFLDLSGNGMGKIENGSFQWLSKLQQLILEENNLKHLTRDTFRGLRSLKALNLKRALIKSHSSATPIIDDFSFQALTELESLDMRSTSIREITANTFTGLRSLTELDLSWSSCQSLKHLNNRTWASLAGSPLRTLNLTGTALVRIDPGAFSHLKNLTSLFLDFNYVRQTLTGWELEGLESIRDIHWSNNNQGITLTSKSFIFVPSLRALNLGKSLTVSSLNLDPSPFKPLSNLMVLDLSNNNIANLRMSIFEGLADLRVLKLAHNNLARLWKDANIGGPVLFLKGLNNLLSLELDSNGMDEIPTRALEGLTNLRELTMGNNVLNNLRDSVFDSLSSLRVLHMQKNSLTAVRRQVFQKVMSNLSLLVMGRNPFDCTCESISWFGNWLNTTNTTTVLGLRDQYICNTPLSYFNRSILDFDPLSCKDMTPFEALYVLSSASVIMLMFTALLVRFQGWRIQFYWNVLINRTLGFSDATGQEGREFEYDAYVIHAEEDTDWVERLMVPMEKGNCRFCIEDRDSVPGMSQLESIVDNIRRCRKILFIITESLLRDPWCRRFTAHHALHQVIEANRDSVVLVFLQDVHDYKLSRSIFLRRGMLRSSCVLDWPVHRERIPAFHQKLRIALSLTNKIQN